MYNLSYSEADIPPSKEDLEEALVALGLEKVKPFTDKGSMLYCILSQEIKGEFQRVLGLCDDNIPDIAHVPDGIPLDCENDPYTHISTLTGEYMLLQLRLGEFKNIMTQDGGEVFKSEYGKAVGWKIEKDNGVFMKMKSNNSLHNI